MKAVTEIAPSVGVRSACEALLVPRATFYRQQQPPFRQVSHGSSPSRSLSAGERDHVLEELHSDRFVDKSPAEVWATLLDEGRYLCSIRTMYRILSAHDEVRERRNQLRHPNYTKPELLATEPNQVWSWDITKLLGPAKWTYYYLYSMLDIFSRYTVGWMIAERESAALAERLILESCEKEAISPQQLTIHADRGASMSAKSVALLMADLGITKSHSRPYTSTDNPFSESQFRTLKYRPDFPERFGSVADARTFARHFFHWYNFEHRHSGIGYLTPAMLHQGQAPAVTTQRAAALRRAFEAHPDRFVRGVPIPPKVPEAVWINPPVPGPETDEEPQ